MIKGKSKLEFGFGDIKVTGFYSDEKGGVALQQQEPHDIGYAVPTTDKVIEEADVIMTFTDPKSIDILVEHLIFAKNEMLGIEQERVTFNKKLLIDFEE